MCLAFQTRSVGTQRIVGILAHASIDASSKNIGIFKNKGREKGANFRVPLTLEQCLSAFHDQGSLNGRPLIIFPSLWKTALSATIMSGPAPVWMEKKETFVFRSLQHKF